MKDINKYQYIKSHQIFRDQSAGRILFDMGIDLSYCKKMSAHK